MHKIRLRGQAESNYLRQKLTYSSAAGSISHANNFYTIGGDVRMLSEMTGR